MFTNLVTLERSFFCTCRPIYIYLSPKTCYALKQARMMRLSDTVFAASVHKSYVYCHISEILQDVGEILFSLSQVRTFIIFVFGQQHKMKEKTNAKVMNFIILCA